MLRAALPTAALLEVTIRGLPDIKNPPSWFINHSTRKKAFRHNFFARFTPCMLREAEAGSPIKGGLCGAQYQHGDLPRVEEKVRTDGSQRGQEVKRKTRGLSVWWPTKRCRIHILKEVNAKKW